MNRLQTLAGLAALSLLGLTACGPLDEIEGVESSEAVALADDENDNKADRADIALIPVTDVVLPSSQGQRETRAVFRTATGFKAYFGLRSTNIDFNQYWVAFYSAGVKATGGYKATVRRVRLNDAGSYLKVTTRLESPGDGCIVTQALTKPYQLVKFRKPRPAAQRSLFYKSNTTRSCAPELTCATMLCAPNSYCYDGDGNARCINFPTCATAELACEPGTHCEDKPIVCVTAPCAPTAPACVADTCRPTAYAPTAREVAGTFANTAAAPYARNYVFTSTGGVIVEDLVAPCPAGATCIWSGIVSRDGIYTVRGSTISITYNRTAPTGWDLEYFGTLRVVKTCEGKLAVVEDHADGSTRQFIKKL